MRKKLLSMLLCVLLIASMFAGCGKKANPAAGSADPADTTKTEDTAAADTKAVDTASDDNTKAGEAKYPKFITVDVFDGLANYQGIQSGWFAKIVKDKFNMELNMIAPNVAGGGETLFQTRSASGDLGDLIIYGADGGRLQSMVTAGLLLNLTDLISDKENLKKYQSGIDSLNELVKDQSIGRSGSDLWSISSLGCL